MLNRKGYFFLIDSVLAFGILVIGGFLIFSSYSNIPSKENPAFLSEDLMNFFAGSKIAEIDNNYTGLGGELWAEGKITEKDITLLQQIGIFFSNDEYDMAEKFIANITENIMPNQYLFEFRMENKLLYPRNPSKEHSDSKEKSEILIPSKKLVHGYLDKQSGDMFGPYYAEALVWQNTN